MHVMMGAHCINNSVASLLALKAHNIWIWKILDVRLKVNIRDLSSLSSIIGAIANQNTAVLH